MSEPLLVVEDLHVHYGGIHALKGVDLAVSPGEILTLIGANGAGKTTTLRAITGLVRPSRGRIVFAGQDLVGAKPHHIARRGLVMIPEGRRLFVNLTVYENLLLGGYFRHGRPEFEEDLEYIFGVFPRLKERLRQEAGTLSGGERQMLALGRALMARPRLLMMDEPSLGLAPRLVEEVLQIIARIHKSGTTILLIEQNALAALSIAHRGSVLESGRVTLSGTGAELLEDPRVREAYLGEAVA